MLYSMCVFGCVDSQDSGNRGWGFAHGWREKVLLRGMWAAGGCILCFACHSFRGLLSRMETSGGQCLKPCVRQGTKQPCIRTDQMGITGGRTGLHLYGNELTVFSVPLQPLLICLMHCWPLIFTWDVSCWVDLTKIENVQVQQFFAIAFFWMLILLTVI